MDEHIFITPKEGARILRISVDLLYDLINGRRGNGTRPKVLKVGRAYRLPRDKFLAWANTQTRKPKRKR
jgi:hypothetical protein